jgi:hypothetical protein
MSPVSTKMSINHCQNSFTLEEGSPRDCLHVQKTRLDKQNGNKLAISRNTG